jgi:hypothetical protein
MKGFAWCGLSHQRAGRDRAAWHRTGWGVFRGLNGGASRSGYVCAPWYPVLGMEAKEKAPGVSRGLYSGKRRCRRWPCAYLVAALILSRCLAAHNCCSTGSAGAGAEVALFLALALLLSSAALIHCRSASVGSPLGTVGSRTSHPLPSGALIAPAPKANPSTPAKFSLIPWLIPPLMASPPSPTLLAKQQHRPCAVPALCQQWL